MTEEQPDDLRLWEKMYQEKVARRLIFKITKKKCFRGTFVSKMCLNHRIQVVQVNPNENNGNLHDLWELG